MGIPSRHSTAFRCTSRPQLGCCDGRHPAGLHSSAGSASPDARGAQIAAQLLILPQLRFADQAFCIKRGLCYVSSGVQYTLSVSYRVSTYVHTYRTAGQGPVGKRIWKGWKMMMMMTVKGAAPGPGPLRLQAIGTWQRKILLSLLLILPSPTPTLHFPVRTNCLAIRG